MWEEDGYFVAKLYEFAGYEADGLDMPVDGVGGHYYEWLLMRGHGGEV